MDPQVLGQRIRAARLKKGLSQEDFAALISRDQRGVSEYERGERRISVTDLPTFASVLEVSILYFFEDEVTASDLEQQLLSVFNELPTMQTKRAVIDIVRAIADIPKHDDKMSQEQ